MEMDSPQPGQEVRPARSLPAASVPRWRRRFASMFIGLTVLAGVTLSLYLLPTSAPETAAQSKEETKKGNYLAGWEKPDLTIIVTGQMHGYLQPCGCSRPQYGGLERRFNFIQSLRDKGWEVMPLDYGELAQTANRTPQSMDKYVTAMRALKLMGYGAVALGKPEFNGPLVDMLANYSLNDPNPTPLATNLAKTEKGEVFFGMNVRQYKVIDSTSPPIAVVAIADPKIQQIADPDCKFTPPVQALAETLKEVKAKTKAQLIFMLYQGTDAAQEAGKIITDYNQLRKNNRKEMPGVSFVLCHSGDPEPPSRPKSIEGTQLVTVGHKGRYVGVIGLYKRNNGTAFELKYELVSMGPEFDTNNNNAVSKLMEEYTKKIAKEDYMSRFHRGPHPIQAQLLAKGIETKYVGSEVCSGCHEHAAKVWNQSRHSHAFASLEKATHPSLRQFDGECVVCHTVGFQHNTGYHDPGNDAKRNKKLLNVGCENCHGPGSAHANNPQKTDLYPLINPLSTKRVPPGENPTLFVKRRMVQIDGFCQKCHDLENDVHWSEVPFTKKWQHIDHNFPPREQPKAAGGGAAPAVNPDGIRVDTDIDRVPTLPQQKRK